MKDCTCDRGGRMESCCAHPYQFSHNPSDGIDELPPDFHHIHPDDSDPIIEWGVWRTSYADHGGEG